MHCADEAALSIIHLLHELCQLLTFYMRWDHEISRCTGDNSSKITSLREVHQAEKDVKLLDGFVLGLFLWFLRAAMKRAASWRQETPIIMNNLTSLPTSLTTSLPPL